MRLSGRETVRKVRNPYRQESLQNYEEVQELVGGQGV